MTSHHVTCHVTATSLKEKEKEKEIQKKRNQEKIDKRKRKMLVSKRSITHSVFLGFSESE